MLKRTVLVADDEDTIRLLVTAVLSDHYLVLEAGNGLEAIEMAHRDRPDLILMDIMMPEMDGTEACYILKSDPETKAIPIIMLTALTGHTDEAESRIKGADDYIRKPFHPYELLKVIHALLSPASADEAPSTISK